MVVDAEVPINQMRAEFMGAKTALLSILLCLPSLALADCRDAQTQSEMNSCAAKGLAAETKEINAVYVNLMRTLDKQKQARLREVQLQWIKFKDLNCQFDSGMGLTAYFTMQPLLEDTCKEQLTRARIKDLKAWTESMNW